MYAFKDRAISGQRQMSPNIFKVDGYAESSYAKVDTRGSDALGFELDRRAITQR